MCREAVIWCQRAWGKADDGCSALVVGLWCDKEMTQVDREALAWPGVILISPANFDVMIGEEIRV